MSNHPSGIFATSSKNSILDHMFIYYGSLNPIIVEPGADVDIKAVEYEP